MNMQMNYYTPQELLNMNQQKMNQDQLKMNQDQFKHAFINSRPSYAASTSSKSIYEANKPKKQNKKFVLNSCKISNYLSNLNIFLLKMLV